MHLYSGLSPDLIRDSVHNCIAEKVKDARAVSQVIDDAKLHDRGNLLEYQLPMSSSRLDCMVTGQDADRRDARCGDAGADTLVTTRMGGALRDVLHPSAQVGHYQSYLEDSHTAFDEAPSPIRLASSTKACSPTPLPLDPRPLARVHRRRRRSAAGVPARARPRGPRRARPAPRRAEPLPPERFTSDCPVPAPSP